MFEKLCIILISNRNEITRIAINSLEKYTYRCGRGVWSRLEVKFEKSHYKIAYPSCQQYIKDNEYKNSQFIIDVYLPLQLLGLEWAHLWEIL